MLWNWNIEKSNKIMLGVFVNDEHLNDAAIKTNEEIRQCWNRHVYNMMLPQNYLKYAVSETEKKRTINYV